MKKLNLSCNAPKTKVYGAAAAAKRAMNSVSPNTPPLLAQGSGVGVSFPVSESSNPVPGASGVGPRAAPAGAGAGSALPVAESQGQRPASAGEAVGAPQDGGVIP